MAWIMFFLGLLLGSTMGIMLMCLFFVSKENDFSCPYAEDPAHQVRPQEPVPH
ncbi:MAG: DUF3789 domain-containing protein [Deltaproteobacteria bacterium]|nr:DUF3789 domain-containing protein [Deltaproteobacteria bacterium]